jgi:uncharacterized repeat protein (TIGR03803 family)
MRVGSRKVLTRLFAVASILAGVACPIWCATTFTVLHNFGASNDGAVPAGPLLLNEQGKLYGVTAGGPGSDAYGAVFELISRTNGKWSERLLHSFTAGDGSAYPYGSLVVDRSGNLYGTTSGYLSFAVGGIFKLSASQGGWDFAMLYSDNAGPGLVFDKLGNLYGEIGPGDYHGAGAIGELSSGSNGWNYTQLYSFCSQQRCEDGFSPAAPPIWDGHGNLYGTTYYGGIGQPACWNALGCGVIFKMTPNSHGTWTYHVLHRFASWPTDGQTPNGGLVRDSSGSFYGTTGLGGDKNHGTVFKITFNGRSWRKTVLYDFPNCGDGCAPSGTLVFDRAGSLYGAGDGGNSCGPAACGLIFKLTPQKNGNWKYSIVHKFKGTDGNFPLGVIVDGKGNLFGTAKSGGTYNAGVAFEITQ